MSQQNAVFQITLFAAVFLNLASITASQAAEIDFPLDGVPLKTPWVAKKDRQPIEHLEIACTNQDDEKCVLKELTDRPTLITFFYTRCQNNYKCSEALTRFTALQRRTRQLGLDGKVRLLAVTYEPAFDNSARIKRFCANRGLEFTKNAQALSLDERKHEAFIRGLRAPVSFNGGSVNTHGVALHVLDAKGRLVRQYHTLLWDNAQVVNDIRKLIAEK